MQGKTYKVRLKVSSKKALNAFKKMSGVYRASYNLGIEAQFYKQTHSCQFSNYKNHWISGTKLHKILHDHDVKPFMKEVDNGIFDAGVFASSKAFTNAFRLKVPKFYSRKKTGLKFKTYGNVKVFYDYINIPKLGRVDLCEKGRIPQGKKYSNITFSNDGEHWYISVEVQEPTTSEVLTGSSVSADILSNGDLVVNNELIENITNTEKYINEEKKLSKLKKKLIRQARNNNHINSHEKRITEITKNSIKTKTRITKIKNRLENIRKDFFRKVSNEVARTKPFELHILSKGAVKTYKQNFLSRAARRSDSNHLYTVLSRRMALLGTKIVEHSNPLDLQNALGSRA